MSRPWWSGGRLIAAALALATTGAFLSYTGLHRGHPGPQAIPDRATAPRAAASQEATAHPGAPSAPPATTTQTVRPSATAETSPRSQRPTPVLGNARGELPPPDSGPEADPLIQQALDRASLPDLPSQDELALVEAGRSAWQAETARYTRMRIQAVTARREPGTTDGQVRAVVRLVWAGADPAGTYLDNRPAALSYVQNGHQWNRT